MIVLVIYIFLNDLWKKLMPIKVIKREKLLLLQKIYFQGTEGNGTLLFKQKITNKSSVRYSKCINKLMHFFSLAPFSWMSQDLCRMKTNTS